MYGIFLCLFLYMIFSVDMSYAMERTRKLKPETFSVGTSANKTSFYVKDCDDGIVEMGETISSNGEPSIFSFYTDKQGIKRVLSPRDDLYTECMAILREKSKSSKKYQLADLSPEGIEKFVR